MVQILENKAINLEIMPGAKPADLQKKAEELQGSAPEKAQALRELAQQKADAMSSQLSANTAGVGAQGGNVQQEALGEGEEAQAQAQSGGLGQGAKNVGMSVAGGVGQLGKGLGDTVGNVVYDLGSGLGGTVMNSGKSIVGGGEKGTAKPVAPSDAAADSGSGPAQLGAGETGDVKEPHGIKMDEEEEEEGNKEGPKGGKEELTGGKEELTGAKEKEEEGNAEETGDVKDPHEIKMDEVEEEGEKKELKDDKEEE